MITEIYGFVSQFWVGESVSYGNEHKSQLYR